MTAHKSNKEKRVSLSSLFRFVFSSLSSFLSVFMSALFGVLVSSVSFLVLSMFALLAFFALLFHSVSSFGQLFSFLSVFRFFRLVLLKLAFARECLILEILTSVQSAAKLPP